MFAPCGPLSVSVGRLEDSGTRPQRLLWASTGVKDPSYPPARYVIELVLRDTVNTMPPATLQAVATATRTRAAGRRRPRRPGGSCR